MNLGNQLYSTLSRLSRQMFLLLDELPAVITVEDTQRLVNRRLLNGVKSKLYW